MSKYELRIVFPKICDRFPTDAKKVNKQKSFDSYAYTANTTAFHSNILSSDKLSPSIFHKKYSIRSKG